MENIELCESLENEDIFRFEYAGQKLDNNLTYGKNQ